MSRTITIDLTNQPSARVRSANQREQVVLRGEILKDGVVVFGCALKQMGSVKDELRNAFFTILSKQYDDSAEGQGALAKAYAPIERFFKNSKGVVKYDNLYTLKGVNKLGSYSFRVVSGSLTQRTHIYTNTI